MDYTKSALSQTAKSTREHENAKASQRGDSGGHDQAEVANVRPRQTAASPSLQPVTTEK